MTQKMNMDFQINDDYDRPHLQNSKSHEHENTIALGFTYSPKESEQNSNVSLAKHEKKPEKPQKDKRQSVLSKAMMKLCHDVQTPQRDKEDSDLDCDSEEDQSLNSGSDDQDTGNVLRQYKLANTPMSRCANNSSQFAKSTPDS